MPQQSMPQEKDWERFWIKDSPKVKCESRVSWSKRRIMTVLEKYAVKGANALDAGCGSGFFARYFCDLGMRTAALDYSDQALELARQATDGKARAIKANLLENQLTTLFSETFELIFTDGLFEHFTAKEQDLILQNLKGVLAPEGVIVTFVPNRWSPWELIRPIYMPGIKEVPFQFKELVDLNERNCLKIIEKGGVNILPVRFSPDRLFGPTFGMLLYTVAKRATSRN